MAQAPQTTTRQLERPISSPINTAVVDGTLTTTAMQAHVMVCGDTGAGKVLRVRQIAEQSLRGGRQVIYFSNNDRCLGLANAFRILRFGRRTHAVEIGAGDGEFFAQVALDTDQSMAFDFSEMTVEEVSTFLSGFLREVGRSKKASMDVFFESLDDLIGRKRHRDRNTVNTFKSLLLRGPATTGGNDVRIVVGAVSPEEVPIETSRHSMTLIATCTSNPANIEALSNHVRGDVRILRYHAIAPSGIRHILDHQQWLWAFSDRCLHMPHYLELPALESDAGGTQDIDVVTTDGENAILKDLAEARREAAEAEAERSAEKQHGRHRAVGRCVAPTIATKPASVASTDAALSCISHRRDIARVDLCIALHGRLKPVKRLDQDALAATIRDESYRVPAAWLGRAFAVGTLGDVVSPAVAASAYRTALSEDAALAKTFFEGLGGMTQTSVAGGLKMRLAGMKDVPMRSDERRAAILSAWRAYRASNPKAAANDDAESLTAA